jgi:hypothetical protein
MKICWFCKDRIAPPYRVRLLVNVEGRYDMRYDYICEKCERATAITMIEGLMLPIGLNN